MKKKCITVIGDIHGIIGNYLNIIKESEYSIQLGDHSFNYSHLDKINPSKNFILKGNHDFYDKMIPDYPHFLGDFGIHTIPLPEGKFEFFFIRGGFSIDRAMRMEGVNWFPQEELNYVQGIEAIEAYAAAKPEIVMSHEAPAEIIPLVVRNDWNVPPSYTAKLLQRCFEIHQPKIYIHAHLHRGVKFFYEGKGVTYRGKQIDNGPRRGTLIIALGSVGEDVLDHVDFDEKGNFVQSVDGSIVI